MRSDGVRAIIGIVIEECTVSVPLSVHCQCILDKGCSDLRDFLARLGGHLSKHLVVVQLVTLTKRSWFDFLSHAEDIPAAP